MKTGKLKNLRRTTEEIRYFYILKKEDCNTIKLCSSKSNRLMNKHTNTKKTQR
jgi:hypothetical protein